MEESNIGNATPVSNSTTKVQQSNIAFSMKPSAPNSFPIVYADNQWDIAAAASKLAELAGSTGTFDQHTINELFAQVLLTLLQPPVADGDFTDDFTSDFD